MNSSYSVRKILKSHKLRVTRNRIDILSKFLDQKKGLSLGSLERFFPSHDRITIYRTLNSFLVSGIIHKIPNEQGIATYGLCFHTCSPENHIHNHIHFQCNTCGKMECMEGTQVPIIEIPKGYSKEHINVIVDGVCIDCSASSI